jgi:hypothetical protein
MRRYVWAAIVGAGIGFAIGIPLFPVWEAWVSEFQTLIAALLAIVVGYLTIQKMADIDRQVGWRHNQLIDLTLRPDRLKITRSVDPFLPAIAQAISNLEGVISWPSRADVSSQMLFVAEIENYADALAVIISNPLIKEGNQLFDGKLTIDLQDAEYRVIRLQALTMSLMEEIRTKSAKGELEVKIFVSVQHQIKSIITAAKLLKICLQDVRDGFERLNVLYLPQGYPS